MGKVQEFLSNAAQVDQVAKDSFQKIDTDNREYLDQVQIEQVLTGISKRFKASDLTKDQVQQAMNCIDIDKDGKVSYDEFKTLLVEILKIFASQE